MLNIIKSRPSIIFHGNIYFNGWHSPNIPKMYLLHDYHAPYFLVPPDAVVPLAPECRDNSECPSHAACINRQCLNPCAVLDPCATNAYCRVQNHEPVCTCPPGYLGDPRVSCTKRKFSPLHFYYIFSKSGYSITMYVCKFCRPTANQQFRLSLCFYPKTKTALDFLIKSYSVI